MKRGTTAALGRPVASGSAQLASNLEGSPRQTSAPGGDLVSLTRGALTSGVGLQRGTEKENGEESLISAENETGR